MNYRFVSLSICCALLGSAASLAKDFIALPDATNALRFRLYTNASADASHLLNTFEIEAYGEVLVPRSSNALLHNTLINGQGPRAATTNNLTVLDRATGPEWSYIAVDATAAYQGQVNKFKRSVLFVEPDLFVLYDHVETKEPSNFRMLLHLPAAVRVDPAWLALRLDLPKAGMTVHTPVFRNQSYSWQPAQSLPNELLTNTVTMQLAPTNKLAVWDVITIFGIHRAGEKKSWAFKLLQSDTAYGARIFRNGLPILVGFVTDPAAPVTGVAGFEFKGPVGVYVYRPELRR